MKTRNILLITASAMALPCCAPYPVTNLGPESDAGASLAAAELKKYKKLPTGHPDPQGRPNMVVSPYHPYNIIDVTGYRSGDIVGDPSTGRINPATGRHDASTCKSFRIP